MIEFNQLEQLICIAESGTISKASEKLMLSQPAISRSMQRLEADIEVQLFDHYKNKVILNPNGKLFVKFAKQLIQSRDKMVQETQLFDASHRSISIASCTPAPICCLLYTSCIYLVSGLYCTASDFRVQR